MKRLLIITLFFSTLTLHSQTPFYPPAEFKNNVTFNKPINAKDTITLQDSSKLYTTNAEGLTYNENYASIKDALDALFYIPPDISSFSNTVGTVEHGTTVTDVTVNWSINKDVTSQTLTDAGNISPDSRTHDFTSLNITDNKTYTLTVGDGTNTDDRSTTISFRWKRYWGAYSSAVPPTDPSFTISDASIIALTGAGVGTGSELATGRTKSYDGINGEGDYLVFAFPSSWGTPVFIVYGLTNTAFTKVRDNTFTNASGGSTNYQVWVSNSEQNNTITDFDIE